MFSPRSHLFSANSFRFGFTEECRPKIIKKNSIADCFSTHQSNKLVDSYIVFHTCILHGVFVSRDETMRRTHYFLVLRDETLVSRDETLVLREGSNLHLTSTVCVQRIMGFFILKYACMHFCATLLCISTVTKFCHLYQL